MVTVCAYIFIGYWFGVVDWHQPLSHMLDIIFVLFFQEGFLICHQLYHILWVRLCFYWMWYLYQRGILHGRHGVFFSLLLMGANLFLLRGTLKNATISFSDATFTGLELKRSCITFTTKGGVSLFLSPVNPITNSSRLNSQMIATNYCWTF